MRKLSEMNLRRLISGLRRRLLKSTDKGNARPIPNIPLDFEACVYREINPDLESLDDDALLAHYQSRGRDEGRRCHLVRDRLAFVNLIPPGIKTLEIGPYASPLVSGPNVKYVDVRTTDELRTRTPVDGLDPDNVPEISWVVEPSDLSRVDEHFGVVLSSHAIEHQPNLVHHLNQVDHILRPGGRYFALVPDHRYCFDHFMTPSTISDVLEAYLDNRTSHTVSSLLEARLLMTHNDAIEHWKGNHGDPNFNPEFPFDDRIARLQIAVDSYRANHKIIKDEHAWYFTPLSF